MTLARGAFIWVIAYFPIAYELVAYFPSAYEVVAYFASAYEVVAYSYIGYNKMYRKITNLRHNVAWPAA